MRKRFFIYVTIVTIISFFSNFASTAASAPSNAATPERELVGAVKSAFGRSKVVEVAPYYRAPSTPVRSDRPAVTRSLAENDSVKEAVLEPNLSFVQPLGVGFVNTPFLPSFIVTEPTGTMVSATDGNFCDSSYVGEPMTFMQSFESNLDDLLNQIHNRFGVNFVIGPKVGQLPINIKSQNIPWTSLLRSQLFVLGVTPACVENKTIQLIKTGDISVLEKDEESASRLAIKYIKLKYLQPSSGGNKNVAGQTTGQSSGGQGSGGGSSQCQQNSQGGGGGQSNIPQGCKFERLILEIRQIIGLNDLQQSQAAEYAKVAATSGNENSPRVNDFRKPYVGQVPGRNMLLVLATEAKFREIDELIKRADIPPFQVVIKGLVYTANESRLKDIGVNSSLILGTGNLNRLGGITSQPPTTPTGTGQTAPGGVRSLGPGFALPTGNGDSIFGVSAIVGTAQFSVQATALEQNGVISVKSRPFATVLDGDATDLTVGRQVPVLIQAVNSLGGQPGTLQILQAANLLSVTPHVIDDDNGNPVAVNLELQLESNDVDTSVISQGVPSVAVRSIQSKLILNQEQTVILGGFTVDSDSKTISKTPGLSDIPIFGELFKRRVRSTQINRLYFAISVTIVPYGSVVEPVKVPGATTEPQSITPNMKRRADEAEPKTVAPSVSPKKKDSDH